MRRGLCLSKKHPLMGSTVMEELKCFRRHCYRRNTSDILLFFFWLFFSFFFYKSLLKQETVHSHCIERPSSRYPLVRKGTCPETNHNEALQMAFLKQHTPKRKRKTLKHIFFFSLFFVFLSPSVKSTEQNEERKAFD